MLKASGGKKGNVVYGGGNAMEKRIKQHAGEDGK